MKYPWIFLTILCIWLAIAAIINNAADRVDPTTLYLVGAIFTTLIAIKGFKTEVY